MSTSTSESTSTSTSLYSLFDNLDYYRLYSYGRVRSIIQPYLPQFANMNRVMPNLYIGDLSTACDTKYLAEHGITHIVTVVTGVQALHQNMFQYLLLDLRDQPSESINRHFDQCSDFIAHAIRSGGRVLVHCMCGISRSATLIIAYLIRDHGFTPERALDLLKTIRPCVQPNEGFMRQLDDYFKYRESKVTTSRTSEL